MCCFPSTNNSETNNLEHTVQEQLGGELIHSSTGRVFLLSVKAKNTLNRIYKMKRVEMKGCVRLVFILCGTLLYRTFPKIICLVSYRTVCYN
jgi:hypothetical protein